MILKWKKKAIKSQMRTHNHHKINKYQINKNLFYHQSKDPTNIYFV